MEFSDIKEQHRTLWGEEIFRTLAIGGEYLRILAEHEARGRLLRLQALYLERAGEPTSVATNLTRLAEDLPHLDAPSSPGPRKERSEKNYGEVLSPLFEQHSGFLSGDAPRNRHSPRGEGFRTNQLLKFFREYLEDVRRLVSLIDGLPQQSTLSPRQ